MDEGKLTALLCVLGEEEEDREERDPTSLVRDELRGAGEDEEDDEEEEDTKEGKEKDGEEDTGAGVCVPCRRASRLRMIALR